MKSTDRFFLFCFILLMLVGVACAECYSQGFVNQFCVGTSQLVTARLVTSKTANGLKFGFDTKSLSPVIVSNPQVVLLFNVSDDAEYVGNNLFRRVLSGRQLSDRSVLEYEYLDVSDVFAKNLDWTVKLSWVKNNSWSITGSKSGFLSLNDFSTDPYFYLSNLTVFPISYDNTTSNVTTGAQCQLNSTFLVGDCDYLPLWINQSVNETLLTITVNATGSASVNATVALANYTEFDNSNLILYYRFDNETGSPAVIKDYSPNGYNGTSNYGNMTFESGKYLFGARFENKTGANSLLTPTIDNLSVWSISLWVYPYSTATASQLIMRHNNYGSGAGEIFIGQSAASQWRIAYRNASSVINSLLFQINRFVWSYYAFTYNGSHVSVYINGRLNASKEIGVTQLTAKSYSIGGVATAGSNLTLDELVFFNYSLTPEQVLVNYERGMFKYDSETNKECGTVCQFNLLNTTQVVQTKLTLTRATNLTNAHVYNIGLNTTLKDFIEVSGLSINPLLANLTDVVEFNVSVLSGSGIDSVRFNVTSPDKSSFVLLSGVQSAGVYNFSYATNLTQPVGNYTVVVFVNNTAGLANNSVFSKFELYDTVPPSVVFDGLVNDTQVNIDTQFNVTCNVSDNQNVSSVDLHAFVVLLGVPLVYPMTQISSTQWFFNASINAETVVLVSCNATDVYGNTNQTEELTINVSDMNSPLITITYPINNSIFANNTDINILAAVTDFHGVDTVWYNITLPDNNISSSLMSPVGDGTWQKHFAITGQYGLYQIKISANDTTNRQSSAYGYFWIKATVTQDPVFLIGAILTCVTLACVLLFVAYCFDENSPYYERYAILLISFVEITFLVGMLRAVFEITSASVALTDFMTSVYWASLMLTLALLTVYVIVLVSKTLKYLKDSTTQKSIKDDEVYE